MSSVYLTETVTFTGRRRQVDGDGKPVTDNYGNDVYTAATFTVPDCSIEPRASTENVDNRDQVTTGLVIYCADPAVDVRATDRATWQGVVWEVSGEASRFTGSRFGNDHAVLTLRRVTG